VIRAMSLANPLWGAPRMENSSSSASMLVKPRSPNAWQGTGDPYLKTGRRSSGTTPMGVHRLTVEQDHRSIKLRLGPMLGLKHFQRASITIAGIELMHRIRKGQFKLGKLCIKDNRAPEIWNAVLAA
jgi:hypothetical protein